MARIKMSVKFRFKNLLFWLATIYANVIVRLSKLVFHNVLNRYSSVLNYDVNFRTNKIIYWAYLWLLQLANIKTLSLKVKMVTRNSHSSNDGETRNFSDVTTDTIIHRTRSPSTSSSNDGETRNFSDVTTDTIIHRTRSPSTNSSNDGETRNFSDVMTDTITHRTH